MSRATASSGRKAAGGAQAAGEASDCGEGEDDFVFSLTKEEFMQVFFEDLALPHLIRTQLAEVPEWKSHRAGFTSDGMPTNLHVVRSMRGALARRIALGGDSRREIRELEAHLLHLQRSPAPPTRWHSARSARPKKSSTNSAATPSTFPTSTRSTCVTATA